MISIKSKVSSLYLQQIRKLTFSKWKKNILRSQIIINKRVVKINKIYTLNLRKNKEELYNLRLKFTKYSKIQLLSKNVENFQL